MMNRNDRMNTLNNAGIDTSKYFNLHIDKTLPKGTTLTITIGDDGMPVIADTELKETLDKIDEQGYVKNSKLFRRWVMAQTFRMMNSREGYTAALNAKPYAYQWTMLENELHAMAKIEKEDKELFAERKVFFTKEVILFMLDDYRMKLMEYCSKYRWMNDVYAQGSNIAYITISAVDKANNYASLYHIIKTFNEEVKTGRPYIGLPKDTKKSKDWMEAYKGAGAYYTLQNMYRFHLKTPIILPVVDRYGRETFVTANNVEAERILNEKKSEYRGEWYKLFGYFKRVVEINHFDFGDAMKKAYEEKSQRYYAQFGL